MSMNAHPSEPEPAKPEGQEEEEPATAGQPPLAREGAGAPSPFEAAGRFLLRPNLGRHSAPGMLHRSADTEVFGFPPPAPSMGATPLPLAAATAAAAGGGGPGGSTGTLAPPPLGTGTAQPGDQPAEAALLPSGFDPGAVAAAAAEAAMAARPSADEEQQLSITRLMGKPQGLSLHAGD